MIRILLNTLLLLLGFEDENNKTLYKQKNTGIQITPVTLMIITLIAFILFVALILTFGVGTESGVYYNNELC